MKHTPLNATKDMYSDAKDAKSALEGLQSLEHFENLFTPGEQCSIMALHSGIVIKQELLSKVCAHISNVENNAALSEADKKTEMVEILRRTNGQIKIVPEPFR